MGMVIGTGGTGTDGLRLGYGWFGVQDGVWIWAKRYGWG